MVVGRSHGEFVDMKWWSCWLVSVTLAHIKNSLNKIVKKKVSGTTPLWPAEKSSKNGPGRAFGPGSICMETWRKMCQRKWSSERAVSCSGGLLHGNLDRNVSENVVLKLGPLSSGVLLSLVYLTVPVGPIVPEVTSCITWTLIQAFSWDGDDLCSSRHGVEFIGINQFRVKLDNQSFWGN